MPITCQPRLRSSLATALPMPELVPVTSAKRSLMNVRRLWSENEAHGAQGGERHCVEDGFARLDLQLAVAPLERVAGAADVLAHVPLAAQAIDHEVRFHHERRLLDDAHIADQAPRARARRLGMGVWILQPRDARADAAAVAGGGGGGCLAVRM